MLDQTVALRGPHVARALGVTEEVLLRSKTYFKQTAQKRRVPYQRVIRALVDAYAEKQEGKGMTVVLRKVDAVGLVGMTAISG